MPWDADGIDEFLGYLSKGGPDKVENVLQNSQSFRALGAGERLQRGDVIAWRNIEDVLDRQGREIWSTSHMGIYVQDNLVFSKLGMKGNYLLLPLGPSSPLTTFYGNQFSFWRPITK